MTVLSRLWAFMTGTFDSFIGLLQRIAFALRGRSYHTGPFAMRVDHGASVRSVRIRVDHGRSLPVRGAATEPVAFPIHRVVADIPGDVEAGNFRPLPTHHRASHGPNNCVAIGAPCGNDPPAVRRMRITADLPSGRQVCTPGRCVPMIRGARWA